MRFAILNPYRNVAETESAIRIVTAAARLGWEAKEFHRSDQIADFKPEFVLSIAHQDPKLLSVPTYGVLTAPITYYTSAGRFVRNVLTYDGYFTVSPQTREWLEDLCFATRKDCFVDFYANTVPVSHTDTAKIDEQSKLTYFGTNWDGKRHDNIFTHLAKTDQVEFWGPEASWAHVPKERYGGFVPFDGTSVMDVYRRNGIGLCLSKKEFDDNGLPTNRVFEVTAAGAVAICPDNKFVRDIYGDTVLYVDTNKYPKDLAEDIMTHVRWVRENPGRARALATRSLELFNRELSLDKLLLRVFRMHEQVKASKGFLPLPKTNKKDQIGYVMRVGGRPLWMIRRALSTLENQTADIQINVHFVQYKTVEGLADFIASYRGPLKLFFHDEPGGNRSRTLWRGFNEIKKQKENTFFAMLDDDDELFPNHIKLLLQHLETRRELAFDHPPRMVYSGSVQGFDREVGERMLDIHLMDRKEKIRVGEFRPYSASALTEFDFFIVPHSFIACTSLLDREVLRNPDLHLSEDFYLISMLAERTSFAFCPEITCSHNFHDVEGGNSGYESHPLGEHYIKRVMTRLYTRAFPATTNMRHKRLSVLPPFHETLMLQQGLRVNLLRFFKQEPLWRKVVLSLRAMRFLIVLGPTGFKERCRSYLFFKVRSNEQVPKHAETDVQMLKSRLWNWKPWENEPASETGAQNHGQTVDSPPSP